MHYAKLLFPAVLLVASGTVFAATGEGTDKSFDEIDANGDGVVTRDEAEVAPGLVDNFDSLDANADGVLDKSEIGVGGSGSGTSDQPGSDSSME